MLVSYKMNMAKEKVFVRLGRGRPSGDILNPVISLNPTCMCHLHLKAKQMHNNIKRVTTLVITM